MSEPAAVSPSTLLLTGRGAILRADPAWASFTGLSVAELLTCDVWDIVEGADHDLLLSAIDAAAAGADVAELRLRVRHHEDASTPIDVEVVYLDDGAVTPVFALTARSSTALTPGRVHEAWRHGWLTLVAQPIYDSAGFGIIRHELLVRMRLRDGTSLTAAEFLPTAERLGLALDIDCWVAGRAVALLAADVGATSALEVNIGGATVRHPEVFLRTLGLVLGGATVAPRRLTVALPGSAVTLHPEAARRLLMGLAALGVATALDHVDGTADELAVIDLLPFDTIKISGRLASAAVGGEDGLTRLVRVIDAAHRHDAEATVASIDDRATLDLVRAKGADALQGHELGAPVVAEEG